MGVDFRGRKQEDHEQGRWLRRFAAGKAESTVLTLFIPSADRREEPIDQGRWVDAALELLGTYFGGATALPRGRGVWRDDRCGGRLIYDAPVIMHCYTSDPAVRRHAETLRSFLVQMGKRTRQGAVGLVIDRTYLEIAIGESEEDA